MLPLSRRLDHKSLNLVLQASDLVHKITCLVGGDAGSDDCAGYTTSATKSRLARYIDVGNIFVLAQEGEVEEDRKRCRIGGEDDDLGDTSVEGLCGLVGTLLQLGI